VGTFIDIAVPAITFILLAAIGMDLTADDFVRVRRRWMVVVAGLIGPLLLLPPIAIGLVWAFRPPLEVATGLLLVTACPIGGISNTYSYLARASTALSVTLTGTSCLLAAVTIPVVGRALELAVAQPLNLVAPIPSLLVQLLLMLAVPVALGMWVRKHRTRLADRYKRSVELSSFVGVGILLVLVIVDDPHAFAGGLSTTIPLAAAFVASSTAAGWMTATLVTGDHRERFTLAAEFGTRNLGVAIAIAVILLGRVEFARFALTYFLTEVPLMLMAIALFRKVDTLSKQYPAKFPG
jgi:BASS family bile acid:Na+ symporter